MRVAIDEYRETVELDEVDALGHDEELAMVGETLDALDNMRPEELMRWATMNI